MTVLTVGVYGAPPVFVMQPLLITNDARLGNHQGFAELVLTSTGGHVLLVASDASTKHQKVEEGSVEQYDEGTEESRDWEEEEEEEEEEDKTENEEQNQEELERKEDYDSGDYSVGKKYEETTTESQESEESNDYTENSEEESHSYEEPEKDENDSDDDSGKKEDSEKNSTEEYYEEKDESENESESREGKARNGKDNVEDGESGSYCKKFADNRKENGVPDNEPNRQTGEVTSDQKNVQSVGHDRKTSFDKAENEDDTSTDAAKSDHVKSIQVPEEIVIGSINRSRIEDSKNQDAINTEVSRDDSDNKDSSAVVKVSPPLKETEVQLAPVVYHVSPKLLRIAPVQVTGI